MKKLIVLSILCLAFTGCGSKETNTDNVTVETETQIESEVIESETQVESEVTESETIEFETEIELTEEQKLVGFTSIDPIQLYVIEDNPVYGNPNEYLGFVTVNGVSVSEEPMTFTYTYEHSGYKYYGYEGSDGALMIVWEGVLSETPLQTEQTTVEENTITKEDDRHGNMITEDDPRVSDYQYSDDTLPEWMTDELLDLADDKHVE